MAINDTLIQFFEDNGYDLWSVSADNQKIVEFLRADIHKKNLLAKDLFVNIIKQHNKKSLLICLTTLNEIEEQTKTAFIWLRDHYVHALNTFLLGVYINHQFLNRRVDLFQWKLASLFHDIAYPLELANNLIKPYLENMKNIKNNEGKTTISDVTINFFNMYKLESRTNSFQYIQSRFKKWMLDIDARAIYNEMNQNKDIDHGIFSGLTLLQLIESLYKKNNPEQIKDYHEKHGSNWNWEIFEDDIVSACSAIYLHNLKNFPRTVNKNNSPLAYLLKLCDELQDWERPNINLPEGKSVANYDIKISNGKLIFTVSMENDRNKIKINISCLNDMDISITP